jgi:hypothetical protein
MRLSRREHSNLHILRATEDQRTFIHADVPLYILDTPTAPRMGPTRFPPAFIGLNFAVSRPCSNLRVLGLPLFFSY